MFYSSDILCCLLENHCYFYATRVIGHFHSPNDPPSSSPSCINEYLAIYSGGNVNDSLHA